MTKAVNLVNIHGNRHSQIGGTGGGDTNTDPVPYTGT
jgi:hypothetical protein